MDGAATASIMRGLYAIGLALTLCLCGLRSADAMNPQLPFHAYVLDHWNVAQGLPQITVLGITQDRAGFLWVSTQTSVARFDGTNFVTYDRATTGVDTSMLMVAWADPHGQVWFGGARGLLRERDGHFTALGGAAVNAIIDAGDGTPLLATAQGVSRVEDGKIVPLPGYAGPAFSLLRDGERLWIGGLGRVCQRDGSVAPAVTTCAVQGPERYQRVRVNHMVRAAGSVWLGTQAGLLRVVDKRLVPSGLSDELDTTAIESLLTDRDGALWIGTVPALYRRLPDGRVERVDDADIALRPWIRALFEDRAGNLWLGTHAKGLYRVWNGWIRRVSTRDGVTDPLVWSVVRAPEGQLVIGTNSDVEVFDGRRARTLIPGRALPNPSAYELFYDHRGRLWVGTRAGLAVFDHARNVTPSALSALDGLRIDDIREVAADDFWIGTSDGLYRWGQGELRRIDTEASVAAANIRSILPLTPDHLYIGTEDGVREWHAGRLTQPAWAEPLRGHFVTQLTMLKPSLLGIATADAGIGTMHNGQLRMTTRKQGLPSNNAWTINVFGDAIYVGSNAGAWRLPLAQLPLPGSAKERISPQLLAGAERDTSIRNAHCCNGGASARSLVDGHLIWYSTTDGALALDTRAIGAVPESPPAVIDAVERGSRQFPGDALDLARDARDLAIHYTAPYVSVGTLQFRYRLEGYDTEWQDAGTRRDAFYTHLPPGDYRFRVAALLAGAERYGAEADLAIRITPRWYERAAVRGAAFALLCLLLVLAVRWSMRTQRRRNEWLETQVERRTEQLARALERLRVTNLALAEESQTDTLTALQNRRYLLLRLPEVLASGDPVGLLQIDIDHFKQINDRYGHAVGDAVLRDMGRLLAAARRDSDITVRWGGEEFLLLLHDVDAAGVLRVAERLRRDIAAREFPDGRGGTVSLTCSIGFSMHPVAAKIDKATFDAALELSDRALYSAKQNGRDGCVGLVVTAPLSVAILRNAFAPQVDALLASGQLRWIRETS